MGTLERRDREKQATRQRIMDAARNLFVRHGYDAVSMRKIAEAIEYSPAAVYVHFRDKSDLMQAICADDFDRLGEEFVRLGEIKDPIERIRETGKAYLKFAARHPQHYRMMFMDRPPVETPPEKLAHKDDPTCNSYAFLMQAAQQAIDAGKIRPEYSDAALLSQVFWASVHGVASLRITMADDDFIKLHKKLGDAAIETVIRGIFRPKRAS